MGIYAPHIYEETPKGIMSYDIFSRLTKDRIIMISGEVNSDMSASVVSQLLFLAAQDPDKEISIYINSPGGSVVDGMAMYDTMQAVPCDIRTIGVGICASMGSVLLAGGTKGKRCLLPHSEVMIHQVSSGGKGKTSDLEIMFKEAAKSNEMLTQLLAERCGKSYEQLKADMKDDHYMTAIEALEYGIIDEIIEKINEPGKTLSDIRKGD